VGLDGSGGGENADCNACGLGAHDKQVNPSGARELYNDLGAPKKVFVDLGPVRRQRHVGEESPAAVRASLSGSRRSVLGRRKVSPSGIEALMQVPRPLLINAGAAGCTD
jgi:hypothetical protein